MRLGPVGAVARPRAPLATVATLAAALALAGCGGDNAAATGPTGAAASSTAPATAPASFGKADVLFVQMMIPHQKDAVTMAELAGTRSQNPAVVGLAEQIRAGQQPEIDTMVGWVQAAGQPTVPPDFDTGHGPGEHAVPGTMTFAAMVRLRESKGARFDRRFVVGMINHHRGAIVTARTEAARGRSPEVKALARTMLTRQRAELLTLRKILAQL